MLAGREAIVCWKGHSVGRERERGGESETVGAGETAARSKQASHVLLLCQPYFAALALTSLSLSLLSFALTDFLRLSACYFPCAPVIISCIDEENRYLSYSNTFWLPSSQFSSLHILCCVPGIFNIETPKILNLVFFFFSLSAFLEETSSPACIFILF